MKILHDRVNLTDFIVLIILGIALILAIIHAMNELSTTIASGMIGYIGGSSRSSSVKDNDNEKIMALNTQQSTPTDLHQAIQPADFLPKPSKPTPPKDQNIK